MWESACEKELVREIEREFEQEFQLLTEGAVLCRGLLFIIFFCILLMWCEPIYIKSRPCLLLLVSRAKPIMYDLHKILRTEYFCFFKKTHFYFSRKVELSHVHSRPLPRGFQIPLREGLIVLLNLAQFLANSKVILT